MPAIEPARLRKQTAELAGHFQNPAQFLRALHDLLDHYADRTRRPGQSGSPGPLLPGYDVPRPVMRQVHQELLPFLAQDPPAGVALAEALWEEPFLEPRLLAVRILSQLSFDQNEGALDRLVSWIEASDEEVLLEALITEGLRPYRRRHPERYLSLARSWLIDQNRLQHALGLRLLRPMAEDHEFVNLPVIFRLIQSHVHRADAELQPDLLELLGALAGRSPQETAFFLRECLKGALDDGTAALVRRSLRLFPAENRESLRRAMRP